LAQATASPVSPGSAEAVLTTVIIFPSSLLVAQALP
jgi:hypothetical protein